jgi:hypothetical protein
MRFSVATITLILAAACSLVVSAPIANEKTDETPSLRDAPEILTTTIWDTNHGLCNLSYFLDNTDVIIESDVIFGTVDQLNEGEAAAAKVLASGTADQLTRRGYTLLDRPWPDATVRYHWATPGSRTNFKDIVGAAIGRWKAAAPYLRFEEVADDDFGSTWAPVLTIYGEGQSGCYSEIGYYHNQHPRMMLMEQGCHVTEATHEFGHILGTFRPLLSRQHSISRLWREEVNSG